MLCVCVAIGTSAGRNIRVVPRSESADVGDPEVPALSAGGTALRAVPPVPRAATEGDADILRFQAWDKD
eukprot:2037913-Alexandrium_andersonii.AAC.1